RQVGELLAVGNVGDAARQVVAPAVVAAFDPSLSEGPGAGRQLRSPVEAGVVIRPERAVCAAHDEDRLVADDVFDVVARLRHLFDDAGAKAPFHEPEMTPVIEPAVARGPQYEALLANGSSTRDFGPRSGDDHSVLYTGGTTGKPKGVVWRQEDIFFAVLGG